MYNPIISHRNSQFELIAMAIIQKLWNQTPNPWKSDQAADHDNVISSLGPYMKEYLKTACTVVYRKWLFKVYVFIRTIFYLVGMALKTSATGSAKLSSLLRLLQHFHDLCPRDDNPIMQAAVP